MTEFTDRLDAEIGTVQSQLAAQKRQIKVATGAALESASAELRALVTRLDALQTTRRKMEEQSHGG